MRDASFDLHFYICGIEGGSDGCRLVLDVYGRIRVCREGNFVLIESANFRLKGYDLERPRTFYVTAFKMGLYHDQLCEASEARLSFPLILMFIVLCYKIAYIDLTS